MMPENEDVWGGAIAFLVATIIVVGMVVVVPPFLYYAGQWTKYWGF